ncbi:ABC transporter substrate-binding protein [Taibaiella koreensis]|uniref:hypothetical protein n=1 Tax=Taibaiella koreensis TaxID=1268548 RepID=UPI000E59A137|nr:hypothetical protein [Taibaiella koreensis]
MKKIFYLPAAVLLLSSCGKDDNEDVVEQPNKDGSIETVISVTHADSVDLLTTTHKVWLKGAVAKTFVTTDTLKSLGTEPVTNDEANTSGPKEKKKDYEIYITVK